MIVFCIYGAYYLLLTMIRNRVSYKKSPLIKECMFVIMIKAVIFVASAFLLLVYTESTRCVKH